MKKIIILGLALCSMISCKKYDDSELWDAVNKLQADTVKEENTQTVVAIEKGAIKAAFSVEEGKQVYFSMGNLQYNAGSNVWRFATNQWETIGEENENKTEDYSGWIDLFGWGTSGWNSGALCYQPWSSSGNNADYYPGNSSENNLSGKFANADWGVYNKIANGGNEKGIWRTLSQKEWSYLIKSRTNASSKQGLANVNGINGLIILPDEFTLPNGVSFNSGGYAGESYEVLYQTVNTYTLTQWIKMEEAGAVFLPAAGNYASGKLQYFGISGNYWSTTAKDDNYVYGLAFSTNKIETTGSTTNRSPSRSVRLVQDVK
ncbi:MAG: hypothetical protein IKJ98_03540 [Bacteroidales bacterium]|nr:hypothetical protein [Bacteroidales bacterium]